MGLCSIILLISLILQGRLCLVLIEGGDPERDNAEKTKVNYGSSKRIDLTLIS